MMHPPRTDAPCDAAEWGLWQGLARQRQRRDRQQGTTKGSAIPGFPPNATDLLAVNDIRKRPSLARYCIRARKPPRQAEVGRQPLIDRSDLLSGEFAEHARGCEMAGVERVTVTVSYADLPERGALGHRQVTGAYLVALASARGGVLATMDEALAALYPEWCALI